MSGLFGGAPKVPSATAAAASTQVTPAPTISTPIVQQASSAYVSALASAMGRGSTILTGGQGDTSKPNIGRKVLLGGP